jgi:hypothetical protein
MPKFRRIGSSCGVNQRTAPVPKGNASGKLNESIANNSAEIS